ncbi:MAG: Hpt domain-containing protein [Gammaproteobacteria bacterium]|nr:Hpt domain-containing protein [Gammaproteobacteria bacterium]NNJ94326.1 Hpt domain-containing protein [Halobacteria archaeon]
MLNRFGKRIREVFDRRPGIRAGGAQTLTGAPDRYADEQQLDAISRRFSREVFAQLLIELPAQRHDMHAAYAAGNHGRLRSCVHRMLGAAAYCDAPELEDGLRELQLALKTQHPQTIDRHFLHAIRVIDSTLVGCGYRGP